MQEKTVTKGGALEELDKARNDILIELCKLESLVKLGEEVAFSESDIQTQDDFNWGCIFQILEDIKSKAMEKTEILEGLLNGGTIIKETP